MRPARSVDEPEGTRGRLCNGQQYGAMRLARDVHKPDAVRECLYDCLVAHASWLVTLLPELLAGETEWQGQKVRHVHQHRVKQIGRDMDGASEICCWHSFRSIGWLCMLS